MVQTRPNILLAIADDWAWPHASAYGCTFVNTPTFDRVARDGALFENCFCPAPSCSPSRAALLTGKNPWQLGEGGNLWGTLPARFAVYPDLLESAGYHVGYTNKGWAPGSIEASGRTRNPAGAAYNDKKNEPPTSMMNKNDYAENFKAFLAARPAGAPFCFWYGAKEPHRKYEKGSGIRAGKRLEDVQVPPFLPDCEEIRSDLLDYALEIEWFDTHLGRMIATIEEMGELENTLIIVTGDNGMPFPRAKANVYEIGMHVPLAVCRPQRVPGGKRISDFLTFIDLAPTFLEAAGLSADLTGRSILDILTGEAVTDNVETDEARSREQNGRGSVMGKDRSTESERIDSSRDHAITGRERHAHVRRDNVGYPSRCIRTDEWIYIRNFEPDRWPAGDPPVYGDVDASPSKHYLVRHRDEENVRRYFEPAFSKRPAEELYRVADGYGCLDNLAEDPELQDIKNALWKRLENALRAQGDPRVMGDAGFDEYRYYGNTLDRNGNPAFTGTDALRDEGLIDE